MNLTKLFPIYTVNVYDDPPVVPPKVDPPVKTFSQEEVNAIVADNRRKDRDTLTKTTAELEKLKTSAGMTKQEKDELQVRIDELNNTYKTKEELAQQELQRQQSKYKEDLDSTVADRERWKSSFENTTINSAILRHVANDAVDVEQMEDLLKPKSRVVEGKDADGKPNGQFTVMAKVVVMDKKGQPVTLDLPIDEAVKQMKDCPKKYGNLFKSTLSGGLGGKGGNGGTNTGVTGPIDGNDIEKMSNEEYIAFRKSRGLARK